MYLRGPFPWVFQNIIPGGEDVANSIFAFTAGLPVAGARGPFGVIAQTVSLETEAWARGGWGGDRVGGGLAYVCIHVLNMPLSSGVDGVGAILTILLLYVSHGGHVNTMCVLSV